MFFLLIIGLLLALLMILSLVTFLPEINTRFKNFPAQDAISIPEVKINFTVVDSLQTQNLQLFTGLESGVSSVGRKDPFAAY